MLVIFEATKKLFIGFNKRSREPLKVLEWSKLLTVLSGVRWSNLPISRRFHMIEHVYHNGELLWVKKEYAPPISVRKLPHRHPHHSGGPNSGPHVVAPHVPRGTQLNSSLNARLTQNSKKTNSRAPDHQQTSRTRLKRSANETGLGPLPSGPHVGRAGSAPMADHGGSRPAPHVESVATPVNNIETHWERCTFTK